MQEKKARFFFKLFNIIEENSHLLKDKNVLFEAEHNLASWEREVNKNKYASANLNNRIVTSSSDPFFVSKARFGASYNKDLKPGAKAR